MRATLIGLTVGSICWAVALGSAFAASNPNPNHGQPGVECEEDAAMPHGFTTGGFANAEDHYAGSPESASLAHSHSDHAVSEYDVACYQLDQRPNH
jgi:hypothetical protein